MEHKRLYGKQNEQPLTVSKSCSSFEEADAIYRVELERSGTKWWIQTNQLMVTNGEKYPKLVMSKCIIYHDKGKHCFFSDQVKWLHIG